MILLDSEIPVQAQSWRNDPEIMKWCRQTEIITEVNQQEWLNKIKNDHSIRMFGLLATGEEFHGNTATYVGVAGFTSISLIHRHAEFSLYIAPYFQSYGFGKKSLVELLKYGFHNLGLNRIWGEVFIGNPALKMFLDVGFFKEGICRESYFKNGKFIDSEIISILRGEYDNKYDSHSDPAPSVPLSLSMLTTKEESTNSEGDQRPQGIDL